MKFGWQGFSFDHQDEWEPVSLSGRFQEGYVRLANSHHGAIQVRWQSSSSAPDLNKIAQTYIAQLRKDAKKQKIPFDGRITRDGDSLGYQIQSALSSRGSLVYCPETKRSFILEVCSPKKGSHERTLIPLVRSFESSDGPRLWSLLGLSVRIPAEFALVRSTLLAGRIGIELKSLRGKVIAERWGFGEELLRSKGYSEWIEAVTKTKGAIEEDGHQLRISNKHSLLFPTRQVISEFKPEENHIVWVMLESGIAKRAMPAEWPEWEWIL